MKEIQLQENVAVELIALGFDVHTNRKNNRGIPVFRGSKKLNSLKKPDMIVFYKKQNNVKKVSNPFGIEFKLGKTYGPHINKPIEQMRNYKRDAVYITNQGNYSLGSVFLATWASVHKNIIYEGSEKFLRTNSKGALYGIEWAIIRQLYSLHMFNGTKLCFGLFKKDKIGYYIRFPNDVIRLLSGGEIEWVAPPDMEKGYD